MGVALWLAVFSASASAATLRLDNWGATNVRTDPATTTTLFKAGIIPLPIAPTTVALTSDAARYRNPIVGGSLDSKTLAGRIRHSGGILLAMRNDDNSWTKLALERFTIRIDATPDLTAVVGGARIPIATLDLKNAKITKMAVRGRVYLKVNNVGVTLNKTATDAIEATFLNGQDVLPDQVKLGTANVYARTAH